MRIQAGSRATPRISTLLLLAAVGCGARSELDAPVSATDVGAQAPQAVMVSCEHTGRGLEFWFAIRARGSQIGCCVVEECSVSIAPGDIVVGGVPADAAEGGGTLTVTEPWGYYCLPGGEGTGTDVCVSATGTLTLTEFSLATGVVSGSYSLVVVSTGMLLSDVISGTICPVAPGKCQGDPGPAGP